MRRRRMTKVLAGLAAMMIAGGALVGTLSAVATRAGTVPPGVVALRAIAAAWSHPLERVVLPAAAVAGEVRVGLARAGLDVRTASGDIIARGGGQVRIRTASGE